MELAVAKRLSCSPSVRHDPLLLPSTVNFDFFCKFSVYKFFRSQHLIATARKWITSSCTLACRMLCSRFIRPRALWRSEGFMDVHGVGDRVNYCCPWLSCDQLIDRCDIETQSTASSGRQPAIRRPTNSSWSSSSTSVQGAAHRNHNDMVLCVETNTSTAVWRWQYTHSILGMKFCRIFIDIFHPRQPVFVCSVDVLDSSIFLYFGDDK